mmetsp:Transcript_22504/g.39885  ORF Transcript_22504/g.39885 Transcript_22504/m.39885 type:complete len:301 (+) Transcript_22504:67-969(+)
MSRRVAQLARQLAQGGRRTLTTKSPGASVFTLPARADNYGFMMVCHETNTIAAIDPPEASVMERELSRIHHQDRSSSTNLMVLITHHHLDHHEGLEGLITKHEELEPGLVVPVLAPEEPNGSIPKVTKRVRPGDTVRVGNFEAKVLDLSGHTLGHVGYYFEALNLVFSGDAIFPLGCGRLFEGTPEQAFESLSRIAALPDETMIYSAHEYAAGSAAFALSVDPDNKALAARAEPLSQIRPEPLLNGGWEPKPIASVPSSVGEEKKTNPFLTLPTQTLGADFKDKAPHEIFAELRKMKDSF